MIPSVVFLRWVIALIFGEARLVLQNRALQACLGDHLVRLVRARQLRLSSLRLFPLDATNASSLVSSFTCEVKKLT